MTLYDDYNAAIAVGRKVIDDYETASVNRIEALSAQLLEANRTITALQARIAVLEAETDPEPPVDPEPEIPAGNGPVAAGSVGFRGDRSTLRKLSGQTITKAGTVLENFIVTGEINVQAENVTIRNGVVKGSYYGIRELGKAKGLTIENVTVEGASEASIAVQSNNVTVRKCDLSGADDGMKLGGKDVLIENNHIHDLRASAGAHNDGIQCGSASNVIFRGNRIEARNTSCIAMFEGQGTWSNITVENNYLSGAGYLLYAPGTSGTNVAVRNNVFTKWGWGPVADWAGVKGTKVWTSNTDATGKAITA